LNVKFKGPIYNCSGYSKLKFLFLELHELGVNVQIEHIGNKDNIEFINLEKFQELEQTELTDNYINIAAGIGPQLRIDKNAAYNIAYSMFETSSIPENWVKFYNEFDEIWTPSNFCKKSFDIKDIRCHTEVIPLGYNSKLFKKKHFEKRHFTFLAVGQWVDRKGWDLLVKAYTQEFINDFNVRLCIKTNEPRKANSELIKEYLPEEISTSNMPRIMINNKPIGESQVPLLYQEADVYILPSRGEAFGLPFLEAIASGIPVVAPDFGGQTDFINEEVGWLIPIKQLRHLSDRLCKINSAYKGLWFAESDIEDIRQMMRYIYYNRDEVKEKGNKARIFAENYTWEKIAKKAEKRLNEIWEKL